MKNENPTLENGSRWMYLLPVVIIAIIAFAFFYPADKHTVEIPAGVILFHHIRVGKALGLYVVKVELAADKYLLRAYDIRYFGITDLNRAVAHAARRRLVTVPAAVRAEI